MGNLDTSNNSISRDQLGADGVARRRYEIEETAEGRTGLKIVIGLLAANVILMCKNLLFGADEAESHAGGPRKLQEEAAAVTDQDGAAKNLKPTETPEHEEEEASKLTKNDNEGRKHNNTLTSSVPEEFNDVKKPENGFSPYQPVLNTGSRLTDKVEGLGAANVVPFPARVSSPPLSGGDESAGPAVGDQIGDDDDTQPPQGPPNRLPVVVAPLVMSQLYVNQSVVIGMSDFLRGITDPDGDEMFVTNLQASAGTLVSNFDGSWTYTTPPNETGEITFTYHVTDGEGNVVQVASMDILPLPGDDFFGTEEADLIIGTAGSDRIYANGSDDTILAREGSDLIEGGAGDDRILGGSGNDVIYGQGGDDIIFGEAGDDLIFGGDGDDTIDGGAGDDTLLGEAGKDQLFGGEGDDSAFGGEDDDELYGNAGHDLLDGGDGDDQIFGDDGNDIIIGGGGGDTASGGAGNDQFIAEIDDGNDSYDGGSGEDTIDLSGTTVAATIDLSAGTVSSAEVGDDQIANIEHAKGGKGDDIIIDSDDANIFVGNGGDDVFIFISGNKSGKGKGHRDRIEDFEVGDKIDVSLMDGNDHEDGWQKLTFKYDQASFDGIGQVIYKYEDGEDNSFTVIQINYRRDDDDLDEDVDYEIEIVGRHELNESNFMT